MFEGLLPKKEHNNNLMDVLFILAHWHALAKLRQHTDLSLEILQSVTVDLGKILRQFQEKTCSAYDTKELNREKKARINKVAKKSTSNNSSSKENTCLPNIQHPKNSTASSSLDNNSSTSINLSQAEAVSKTNKPAGRLRRKLNLNTYKDHSLGDYVESIRQNGTVDSYSTESVS